MIALLCFFLTLFASPFKSKSRLEAENAALRHQLRCERGLADLKRIAAPVAPASLDAPSLDVWAIRHKAAAVPRAARPAQEPRSDADVGPISPDYWRL
jgi:hypothetical protein